VLTIIFLFLVRVDDPRTLDRPGFLPACFGIFNSRRGFGTGGAKL